MKNTFGQNVTITLFGESHGAAVGAVRNLYRTAADFTPPAACLRHGAERKRRFPHFKRRKRRIYHGRSAYRYRSERRYTKRRLRTDTQSPPPLARGLCGSHKIRRIRRLPRRRAFFGAGNGGACRRGRHFVAGARKQRRNHRQPYFIVRERFRRTIFP